MSPAAWRGDPLTVGLAGLVVAAYAAVLVAVSTPQDALIGVIVQAAFVAPGVAILERMVPRGGRWLALVTLGPVIGLAASTLTLLALWVAGARGPWLFVAAPALAALLAWPAGRLRERWRLVAARPGDARMLCVVLLVVPLIVGVPFARVGAITPEGRAYRQYFTADYVWRRAVVAELAKGDVLPANPYYIHDPLHYYWLPHLLSALEHRSWPDVDLDALLLTRTVLVDAMFVTALYGIARFAVEAPWAALAGVLCGFLATSAEALAAVYVLWRDQAPLSLVRYLNIDAISRWNFGGMPIDGLQRILWYQPHHAAGYLLGILGVMAVARRRRERDPAVFAVAGALLAVSTLISSFAGLMYTTVAAAYEAVATMRRRAWWSGVSNAAWSALPLAIGAATVTALHYVDQPPDHDAGIVQFGVNPLALHRVWLVTAMSAGPALLLGAAGALVGWRRRTGELWPFLAVVPVAMAFYFFVDIRDHQDVYVGWRVGHLTFLALVPFMGLAWAGAAALRGGRRAAGLAGLALVVVVALPTVAIDVFNTQDIVPNGMGRAWKRTEVLTPAELEGLTWLREHTAPRAIVQVDTAARGEEMWACIPAFAERRMAVGLPLSMVPLRKYQAGAARVQWLYHVESAHAAHELAERFGIDYLVVGPPERAAHPGVEARWNAAADELPVVFHNAALSIYRVRHAGT
ncbi:MAG: hypothetical protein JNL48_00895 [Acidobacteria bacterium]|nr:hypothetical protein [Acidobacteriota bacterium]